jgi:hypothetical protein
MVVADDALPEDKGIASGSAQPVVDSNAAAQSPSAN